MQFATGSERTAFVLGFGIVIVGVVVLIAGATVAGLVIVVVGVLDLVWVISKVQRRAPAVHDDHQQPPPR